MTTEKRDEKLAELGVTRPGEVQTFDTPPGGPPPPPPPPPPSDPEPVG